MGFVKIFRFWFPVFFYSGIIFWVSSVPSVDTAAFFPHADKVIHLAEYGLFGFLAARAFDGTNQAVSFKGLLIKVVLLTAGYGLSDEFHQSFVEGRSASVLDLAADTIGGFLGCWIYWKIKQLKGRKYVSH